LLDLDAAFGLNLEPGGRVAAWTNRVDNGTGRVFVKQDRGRKEPGSGRPTLLERDPLIGNKPAVEFRQQELVNHDEDAYDALIQGGGYTWIAVMRVFDQRVGLKDVNTVFGNLRSGGNYEGLWSNLTDDNRLWTGARNGLTFGRFDVNNPMVLGPRLATGQYYLTASRLPSGTGSVSLELYANSLKAVAREVYPVNPAANSSKMVIGQERDAIQHPGQEAFDGAVARLLIWSRPLTDEEFERVMTSLAAYYRIRLD
jgi:hypothetical protein